MTGQANIFPAIISFSPSRHSNRDHNDKHVDMRQYGVRKSHYAIIKGRVNLFKDNLNMTSDFTHWFVDMFLFGLDYFYIFLFFSIPIHRKRKQFIHVTPAGSLAPYELINFARLIESELSKPPLHAHTNTTVTMNTRRNISINTCVFDIFMAVEASNLCYVAEIHKGRIIPPCWQMAATCKQRSERWKR